MYHRHILTYVCIYIHIIQAANAQSMSLLPVLLIVKPQVLCVVDLNTLMSGKNTTTMQACLDDGVQHFNTHTFMAEQKVAFGDEVPTTAPQ